MIMKKYITAAAACILCLMCNINVFALNTPVTISGWSGSFWQCPDNDPTLTPGKTGVRITTDPEIVQEGRGALHIFVEKTADNLNAQAVQSIGELEVGKTYRLTGLFNIPSTSARYRIAFGNTTLTVLGDVVEPQTWSEMDYVFRYDASSKDLRIQASGGGDIYADALSLKEVIYGEDGVTIEDYGEELLVNGDFESDLDFTPPGEIREYTVVNMDTKALISWTNPMDNDFKSVQIYDITYGEKNYICETSEEEYVISGLENNIKYLFLLQTVDDWNNYSDGTIIEVNPVPDAAKFSEAVFSVNGEAVDKLKPGTLNVQLAAKNNSMPEDYSVELIVLLKKDGAMVDINSEYYIIPYTDFRDPYTNMNVEIYVPEGEGYRAELYVWDSFTGMEALMDPIVIN